MGNQAQATRPLSVSIADPQKHQAGKVLIKLWDDYNAKGGLREQEERLEQKRSGYAKGLFELSQLAAKLGKGVPEYTEAYFKALCKEGERELKEAKGNVENIAKELPCYPVFKSEILRAIKARLNPTNFESYSAFKEARKAQDQKTQAQERESEAMRTGQRAEGEATGDSNIATAVGGNRVTVKLSAVLKVLQGAVAGMDADTQDSFADKLATLISEYAPKVQSDQEQKDKVDSKAAVAA